jgi:FecR-like protein
MKAFASVVLVVAVCLSTVIPSSAAADKTLENVRGIVSLDNGPGTTTQPVAVNAGVAIADNEYAVTGGVVNGHPSQGAILLPDSTRILIGQSTRVQMKQFERQPNLTTANFIILNGKIRFAVQHPGGAKANYTFQTSTGQIAVRGTEGDIWAPQPGALQVNVYELTDPNLPVEVTLNDGKVYKLHAGQTLTVGILGAAVAAGAAAGASSSQSATVTSTTQTSTNNFSEFGAIASSAAVAAVAAAAAASSGGIPTVAAVAAGVAVVGGVVIGTTGGSPSRSPAPPANVNVSKSSLTFTPGTGPLTFQASQKGFSGPFHASIDRAPVASVNATSADGTFTVKPKSNGTATITVMGSGASAPVGVSVQATQINVPSSLAFTSVNQTRSFTAQETYYGGSFSAKIDNTSVAKITSPGSSSSSAAGQFAVTAVGNGTATLTVSDTLGHTAPVNVTVNIVSPSPTPTSIPICINAAGGGGPRDGRRHMDPAIVAGPNKLAPGPNPTCTPAGARLTLPPVVRAPQPQPHPIGPQPPVMMPPHLPGMPTPPPMPGGPP